ncbi:glycosyltransferase [Streptomyces sp. NPDC007100]|uniref:glycosyltransferase n=1 Tax=Streptomyces sp. NPDC007100 TaxID=3155602 RepID=UPI0033C0E330
MRFGEVVVAAHGRDTATTPWDEDLRLVYDVSPHLADVPAAGFPPSSSTMPSPRITAVILTCDEEKRVGQCINALAADVDEVLVIDSGSRDSTLQVVRQSGVPTRVIESPWQKDFARQRNLAFDHVTDGWIVMVDADEELAPVSVGALRRCLTVLDLVLPDIDLAVCPEIADVDDQGGIYTDLPRALRSKTSLRYKGRIHERPYDQEGNCPLTARVSVRFTHHGYRPEVIEAKKKLQRHNDLLELCRNDEPHNSKWTYYHAREQLVEALTPTRARELFDLLSESLTHCPPGASDYVAERLEDSWALLCELALRFGGANEISHFAGLLRSVDRHVEATYFETVVAASQTLSRLSQLADSAAAASARDGRSTPRDAGRLHELYGLLALASGRYDEARTALDQAMARGSGAQLSTEIVNLRTMLSHLDNTPTQAPAKQTP